MEYYDDRKERNEAIYAGEAALAALRRAQSELRSARNWGIYDILGGGLISSLIKHNKMNNADSYIREAQYKLERFHKELRDVHMNIGTDLATDDFITFADWFFDGLVADFVVQERINRVRNEVDRMIIKVEGTLSRLRQQ